MAQAIMAAGGSENQARAFYVDEPVSMAKVELDVEVLVIGMGGFGFVQPRLSMKRLVMTHLK